MWSARPSHWTRPGHLPLVAACSALAITALASPGAAEMAPSALSSLVRPAGDEEPPSAAPPVVILRGSNTLVVLPAAGSAPAVVLRASAANGGARAVRYRAVRITGEEVRKGECRPGGEVTAAFPAGVRCLLTLDAGDVPTSVEVRGASAGICATLASPARLCGEAIRHSFFVPRGTRGFSVVAGATGGSGKVQILDPAGKPSAGGSVSEGADLTLRVAVERSDAGRFWTVTAQPGDAGGFGEVRLSLGPEVPPFLSSAPELLALPFIHYVAGGALFLGERDRAATVEAAINVAPNPDRLLRAQMTRQGSKRALWTTRPSPFTTGRVRILLPDNIASGAYDLKTTLMDGHGTAVATHVQRVTVGRGFAFVGPEQPIVTLLPPPVRDASGGWHARLAIDSSSFTQVATRVALYRIGDRQPAFKEDLGHPQGPVVDVRLPKEAPAGFYRMAFSLVGPTEKPLFSVDRSIYLDGGRCFLESPPPRPAKKAALRRAQRARGYVLFAREYHEAFPYNFEPARDDVGRPLTVWATPGEYEPATFGVYTLKELRGARVQVGLLSRVGGGGRIEPSNVDVRLARFWPQRTDDSSTSFRIIPEVLDRVEAADAPAGRVSQYWLTLHVPAGTPAGDYRALVTFRPANAPASELKLLVKVLPFSLARPATRTWGLFANSERWSGCPDAVVEAEMRDMKAHGVDALALSALAHGSLAYAGEKLAVDFTPLSQLIALYRRAGLRGPVVLDLRDLHARIAQARGGGASSQDADVQRLAVVALSELAMRATLDKWPDAVYLLADGPGTGASDAGAGADALLSLGKRAGLSTSMLLDRPGALGKKLAALVDIPCYPPEAVAGDTTASLRKALKDAGKPYWWYGSGCRTPDQEGNLAANRYLAGIAFWRSGAAAHWAWTWQQARGHASSDFDGAGGVDGKDRCLTYPAPGGQASLPTLQWEGVREGIDDYRYLYTFQELVARAKRSNNARAAQYAAQVEKEAQQRLNRLPWGTAPAHFSNYDAHTFRKWLSKYLGTLANKMKS